MTRWSNAALQTLGERVGVDVVTEATALGPYVADYGRLTTGTPVAAVRPAHVEQIQAAVAFASEDGLPLTIRGTGHGQSGQSVAVDSVVLDTTALWGVEVDVAGAVARCRAGTTLRGIQEAAAAAALTMPSTPIFLDLALGGVLSAGGVGMGLPLYGPTAANVSSIDVVTATGRLVRAGPREDRELFDAVRGGLGRFGVIVGAEMELRPADGEVRTFDLLYTELDAWLADQRTVTREGLAGSGEVVALDAFCSSAAQGMRTTPTGRRPFARWFYAMHISVLHPPGEAPSAEDALRDLNHAWLVHIDDMPANEFAFRFEPRFAFMRATGLFEQAHPVIECFVPAGVVPDLLPELLDEVIPLWLGDGERLLPTRTDQWPPFLMIPDAPEIACFSLLLTGVAPPLLDDALSAMRRLHDLCTAAGGKRYPSGWLGMMDPDAWRGHFGDRFDAWHAMVDQCDPAGIFTSALQSAMYV